MDKTMYEGQFGPDMITFWQTLHRHLPDPVTRTWDHNLRWQNERRKLAWSVQLILPSSNLYHTHDHQADTIHGNGQVTDTMPTIVTTELPPIPR